MLAMVSIQLLYSTARNRQPRRTVRQRAQPGGIWAEGGSEPTPAGDEQTGARRGDVTEPGSHGGELTEPGQWPSLCLWGLGPRQSAWLPCRERGLQKWARRKRTKSSFEYFSPDSQCVHSGRPCFARRPRGRGQVHPRPRLEVSGPCGQGSVLVSRPGEGRPGVLAVSSDVASRRLKNTLTREHVLEEKTQELDLSSATFRLCGFAFWASTFSRIKWG